MNVVVPLAANTPDGKVKYQFVALLIVQDLNLMKIATLTRNSPKIMWVEEIIPILSRFRIAIALGIGIIDNAIQPRPRKCLATRTKTDLESRTQSLPCARRLSSLTLSCYGRQWRTYLTQCQDARKGFRSELRYSKIRTITLKTIVKVEKIRSFRPTRGMLIC